MDVYWPRICKTAVKIPVLSFIHLKKIHFPGSAVDSPHGQRGIHFEGTSSAAQVLSQPVLNGLIKELNLSKISAELFASRLTENNLLLLSGTKIKYSRKREIDLLPFSRVREVFFSDVQDFLIKMHIVHVYR